MCYICGREFGSASLEIHLKSCKKKWEMEESKKPKGERRPVPEAPKNFDDIVAGKTSGDTADNYNKAAYENYNDKALMACPNCGRTFLPDRLDVHLKSCNKAHGKATGAGAGSPPKASPAKAGGGGGSPDRGGSQPREIVRPKTLMCYICGREFGTKSLEIHLKSCKQKWENEEAKKPAKDRRPVPEAPK